MIDTTELALTVLTLIGFIEIITSCLMLVRHHTGIRVRVMGLGNMGLGLWG